MPQALRRAHRGHGGGGGSVAEGFTCEVESPQPVPSYSSACEGLGFYDEHEGKQYCVLHFPSADKDLAAFDEAIMEKRQNKDFDFGGVYFPENVSFSGATFKEGASFSDATFEGRANFSDAAFEGGVSLWRTTFKGGARFSDATFEGWANVSNATCEGWADFSNATFEGWANFGETTFKEGASFQGNTFRMEAIFGTTFEGEANFYDATFEGRAEFILATFEGRANFSRATFNGEAIFEESTFKEEGKFWSLQTTSRTVLILRAAEIERPERISFHSTSLRPSAFVDVNAQEFDFTDVEWFRWPKGDELKLEDEIKAVEAQSSPPYPRPTAMRKLQRACRRLMNNAEENRDYATANEFHYWSMVLARKEAMVLAREKSLREGLRRFGLIDASYGALSGYGERPRRAFLVLFGMGTLFAILYVMVAGSMEHVGEAFLYSLAAMVRLTGVPAMAPLTELLQPSEPGLFQLLVTAEGILGPLQIALLALAVRRRVMR
jgi:uncharacterized protein YjbI with pentapeptide repeats